MENDFETALQGEEDQPQPAASILSEAESADGLLTPDTEEVSEEQSSAGSDAFPAGEDADTIRALLETRWQQLQAARIQLQIDQDKLDLEKDKFKQAKRDFKQDRNKKEDALDEERSKTEKLERELRRLNKEYKDAQESLAFVQQEYDSLKNLLFGEGDTLTYDFVEKEKRIEELSRAKLECEQKLNDLKENWWGPDLQSKYTGLEAECERLRNDNDKLNNDISELTQKNHKLLAASLRLQNEEKYAQELVQANKAFEAEIETLKSYYRRNQKGRFSSLKQFSDTLSPDRLLTDSTSGKSLQEIAKHVRDFGLSGSYNHIQLRYSEEMICAFLAGLAAANKQSKLLILQGLSGTGKSSLPQLFAAALGFHEVLISVQPSWRDRNDLLGFNNEFTGAFKETEFTREVVRAEKDPKRIHLIVLDEMNLSRVEYYFADFLSTLEKPKKDWKINLAAADEGDETAELQNIIVSENVWFVGTANDDESIQSITDKVYDRAQIINFDSVPDDDYVNPNGSNQMKPLEISYGDLSGLFDGASKNRPKEQLEILDSLSDILNKLRLNCGARVRAQIETFIPVFVAAHHDKNNAGNIALDMFLCAKILNKLDKRFSISSEEMGGYGNLRDKCEEELGSDSLSYKKVCSFIERYR